MNNEIGRKLTSLTLMTIMLAGGMVIAAPSMMPAASAANQTLFVSAENSEFGNVFSGPTVVEIVVSDPTIQSIDDAHGAPDVTVNGNDVVLAQGTDGSWYAYVADQTYANTANTVIWGSGNGLQYDLHVRYFLLVSSFTLFGNYRVIPFVGSVAVLVLVYLFTKKITNNRVASLISTVIVLQSNLFLTFSSTPSYTIFWSLFYLLSIYLILHKTWYLSPLAYLLSLFSKSFIIPNAFANLGTQP